MEYGDEALEAWSKQVIDNDEFFICGEGSDYLVYSASAAIVAAISMIV